MLSRLWLPWTRDHPLTRSCVISQYTAAVKSSSLDPTAKALATLGSLVEKDAKLTTILSAPTLSNEDKSAIVAELAKQSGAGKDATVKNFLDTLAENNRLSILGGVCEKFGQIMAAARGEVEMTVTSAQVREGSGGGGRNYDLNWESRTRVLTSLCAAPRQQDPEQAGVCCLQVRIRWLRQEAQGHQRGELLIHVIGICELVLLTQ
jgi:hypothetical protein